MPLDVFISGDAEPAKVKVSAVIEAAGPEHEKFNGALLQPPPLSSPCTPRLTREPEGDHGLHSHPPHDHGHPCCGGTAFILLGVSQCGAAQLLARVIAELILAVAHSQDRLDLATILNALRALKSRERSSAHGRPRVQQRTARLSF